MSDRVEVLVGRVGRAHGIRGDLTIDVRTDEPDRRFAIGTAFVTARGTLTIASIRWHSGRLMCRFDEVSDRSVAETLRGTELRCEIDPAERPEDPEEFYDHQLVGLGVETGVGESIGQVTEVLHLPLQDMLVVHRPGRHEDAMIPFVGEFVPTVDLEAGRIVVTDNVGLLADDVDAMAGGGDESG